MEQIKSLIMPAVKKHENSIVKMIEDKKALLRLLKTASVFPL